MSKRKIGKDPSVNTVFLPDAEREAQEAIDREAMRKQLLASQAAMREKLLTIHFNYYNGLDNWGSVQIKVGDTVWIAIERAKRLYTAIQLLSTEKLVFIKNVRLVLEKRLAKNEKRALSYHTTSSFMI